MGWSNYYAHVASARVFQTLDHTVYAMLRGWAVSRHPNKKKHWITSKYWRVDDGQGWTFQPPHGGARLARHAHTSIQRHVKVQGARSPYDGDWVYWSRRVGRHPDVPPRVARLLKQQQGQMSGMRVCTSRMGTRWKSITSCPKPRREGGERQPATVASTLSRYENSQRDWLRKVRMTHATLLRSRMNGNVHVRFCSRVGVATPRLRQRV